LKSIVQLSKENGFRCLTIAIVCLLLFCNLVYYFKQCHSHAFIAFFSLICLSVIAVVALTSLRIIDIKSTRFFAVVFLVSGIVFVVLFNPGAVPDEFYHYYSSYLYSDLFCGGSIDWDNKLIQMRSSDANLPMSAELSYQSIASVFSQIGVTDGNDSFTMKEVSATIFDLGTNPIYVKFPSALALSICRFIGADPVITFYCGRVANFLLLWGLACAAVHITPVGKTIFKTVCLLPMMLHVGASYSYDTGTIGLTFFATALVLKIWMGEKEPSVRLLCFSVLAFAMLAPCKVVYSLVVIIALLVPLNRFGSSKQAYAYKIVVCAACVLSILIMRLPSILSLVGPVSTQVSNGTVDDAAIAPYYSMGDAISSPLYTLWLFFNTFVCKGDFYIKSIVGGSLGWFQANIIAPNYFVIAYILLLVFALIRDDDDSRLLDKRFRLAAFTIAGLVWLAVMISMYLAWTANTSPTIEGVQGRYLLPVLPLLALSLRGERLSFSGSLLRGIIPTVVFVNAIYLMHIMAIVLA